MSLLDRSGDGKVRRLKMTVKGEDSDRDEELILTVLFGLQVYPLIGRRLFSQMEAIENINGLVTVSGKKRKVGQEPCALVLSPCFCRSRTAEG